ncbi:S8 family peptidase [Paenibacillus chitinolyticus]|uniref:S8 family peptidase n=1 Tax=Paenibacillus chitinolyticus TaxID=79263 RepID=UPI00363513FB
MTSTREFSHIPIKVVRNAPPRKPKGGGRAKNLTTESNKQNRNQHGNVLFNSMNGIKQEWGHLKEERIKQELPELPDAVSLFLRVDTDSLPLEDLRVFGIEVISELEEGFILGAAADITLSELESKIQKFISSKENKAAGLWEIAHGLGWKPQNILSPELFEEWPALKDEEVFVLDVGIACLGTERVPPYPNKDKLKNFERARLKWEAKRDNAYSNWHKLADERVEYLKNIVKSYNGQIIELYEGSLESVSQLPDSFTCRMSISGKGLRDIVLNFPYCFDVSEVHDTGVPFFSEDEENINVDSNLIEITSPSPDAPYVCIIDSGIQERHIFLKSSIHSSSSKSWVNSSSEVADYVAGGGHGTRVAGATLFPQGLPPSGKVTPICWIQNARVLNELSIMPKSLFPPRLLEEIVDFYYHSETRTRIYNQSINSLFPCRLIHMSSWAASIDNIIWNHDVLFLLSAGNLNKLRPQKNSNQKLGIIDHLIAGRKYPSYLLEPSSRICDPAQSLQAVTVGSVAIGDLVGTYNSYAKATEPSSFSCTGLGIWGVIKPEIVEYGGDFAYDTGNPPNLLIHEDLSPVLVRSTMHGGRNVGKDAIGTSYAAPKATHIAAAIAATLPQEPTLLYRALLIQSARWPKWTESWPNKFDIIRHIGYGIPDLYRATENSPYRITLITSGETFIKGRQVHIYEIKIPEELRNPAEDHDIRIDVTLSYKAQPRRTRRHKRRYLSTWLDWKTSKKNESSDAFLERVIELTDDEKYQHEDEIETETLPWVIREQERYGEVKGVSRSSGTLQKDWALIKSHEFNTGFCLAVIGHVGWDTEPEASVPYSLVVSFEAINEDIEIYSKIRIENEIQQRIDIQINSD